jgi:hypothetical protein
MKAIVFILVLVEFLFFNCSTNYKNDVMAEKNHKGNAPEFPEGLDWLNTDKPVRLSDLRVDDCEALHSQRNTAGNEQALRIRAAMNQSPAHRVQQLFSASRRCSVGIEGGPASYSAHRSLPISSCRLPIEA